MSRTAPIARTLRHPSYRMAMVDMAGTAVGIGAWGLVTGVVMVKSGMSVGMAVFMSLVVYAGSAQLAVIPLMAAGAPLWVIWLTASCVNLRFVIFSSMWRSYFAHLPKDINKTEGEIRIGEVDPGDAIGMSIGFGFSLNPKFSFSLGYKHSYIRPTTSELNDLTEKSDSLQVGALQFGMSYLLTDRFSLNGNFEFGVTEDAPDMRFVLRLPIIF